MKIKFAALRALSHIRLGAIAINTQLLTMQQIRQGMFVMDVDRGDDGAVRQAALTVYANVQPHANVLLLSLARRRLAELPPHLANMARFSLETGLWRSQEASPLHVLQELNG